MILKKVLLVANTDWYLFNYRLAYARYLVEQGMEVCLVTPGGRYTEKLETSGFRWIEWNVGRRTMSPMGEVRAIRRLMGIYRSEKPDLVHHFTIKPVLYGSIAAKYEKVPAVVNSVTGLGYIFLKPGLAGSALRILTMPLYRFAFTHAHKRTAFENDSDRDTFIRMGLVTSSESSVVQGAGVDTSYFHPVPEPEGGIPVVLFPSRMLYDKGLGTLIDAARLLRGRCQVRFSLVGDPDPGNPTSVNESQLRSWEQEGLVEWHGFQKDMLPVYRNCHLVTLPSFGEGLPTVLIEAAACERAVVTTDVAGCRDVVTNGVNGLLVPPNQPEALAAAIESLIGDPERRRSMGVEGRKLVLERFTDDLVNQEIYAIYQQLLEEPG